MTKPPVRLLEALGEWPLDREQRALLETGVQAIADERAEGFLALLRQAESELSSCEGLLAGRATPMPQSSSGKTLNDLFLETLKDIYFAEKKILMTLPKMARAAGSQILKSTFESHIDETQNQIERLEDVFELLDTPVRGKKSDAIEGILDEAKEIIEEYKNEPVLDAGLLAAAQAIEHYQISRYGTLKAWAETLGMTEAAKWLGQNLAEEKKADEVLSALAQTGVEGKAHAG